MPYKDPEERKAFQKKYQREYAKSVRKERFKLRLAEAKDLLGGKCVKCGETEDLQFDHVDPKTKLFNITSGDTVSVSRFWAEVAKCQLLCVPHHSEKSSSERPRGGTPNSKLRDLDVLYVRGLFDLGHSKRAISKEFDVSRATIQYWLKK